MSGSWCSSYWEWNCWLPWASNYHQKGKVSFFTSQIFIWDLKEGRSKLWVYVMWAGQHPRCRDFCALIKLRYCKGNTKNIGRGFFFSSVLLCFCSLYVKIIRLISIMTLPFKILCSYETTCYAIVDIWWNSLLQCYFFSEVGLNRFEEYFENFSCICEVFQTFREN